MRLQLETIKTSSATRILVAAAAKDDGWLDGWMEAKLTISAVNLQRPAGGPCDPHTGPRLAVTVTPLVTSATPPCESVVVSSAKYLETHRQQRVGSDQQCPQ